MNINPGQLKAWITFLIGLGAAGYAAYYTLTQQSLTHSTPAAVIAAVLLGIERYVSDPSTGSASTWPVPTTTTIPPVPAPAQPQPAPAPAPQPGPPVQ